MQVRKCFNVTELLCSLREEIKYELVQTSSVSQKCQKVPERVCDTVYEADTSTKDTFQCINVMAPKCSNDERTIYDPTCGTGGMLISCLAEVKRNGGDTRTLGLYGQELITITAAIAHERGFLGAGQRVAFLGIGSGLNCLMLGVEWST